MPLAKNLLQCRISFLKFDQGASIEEFLRDASFHHRYELVGLRPLRVSLPKPLMLAIARESDLVGLRGLEPPTSRLSGVRSNHLSYKPIWFLANGRRFRLPTPFGGDEENRTPDPLLARQVLSQLSYTPIFNRASEVFPLFPLFEGSQSFDCTL